MATYLKGWEGARMAYYDEEGDIPYCLHHITLRKQRHQDKRKGQCMYEG